MANDTTTTTTVDEKTTTTTTEPETTTTTTEAETTTTTTEADKKGEVVVDPSATAATLAEQEQTDHEQRLEDAKAEGLSNHAEEHKDD